MSPLHNPDAQRLLRFNAAVLNQALALVAAHQKSGAPAYAHPVGAHLRHVIEHYEALIVPDEPGVVDYDQRPRDRELATKTSVARLRLQGLLRQLAGWTGSRLDAPVQVRGLGGLAGDFHFAVPSSVGRELVFVASHAIHHYAVLQPHCTQHGIPISAEFGRAPATVAHERVALADSPSDQTKEEICSARSIAA
jgi:hypothetical protein